MPLKSPTLTRPSKAAFSYPSISTPFPTEVTYTCPSCRIIFDTIQDGKDHFRTSPIHAGTYKIPVVSGDTENDANLAARNMITVMETIAEPLASRLKRKVDNRERSSLLVRPPSSNLANTKRRSGTEVAIAPAKKARVMHIDYEDVSPSLLSTLSLLSHMLME